MVVLIVAAPPSGGAGRYGPAPGGPRAPPPPVTMVGLRLRARSIARADTQWSEILRGSREAPTDGALVYRWPGSPLRIAVDVDPAAEEGPVAIEYASDRPVDLAAMPHPVLGATFRRVTS